MAKKSSAIQSLESVGETQWKTLDPFLFCAHHKDHFPASSSDGPEDLGLAGPELKGRTLGSDFSNRNGYSMYHGEGGIPGFPNHPHFGFETITVVTRGFVDHCDSVGQAARYGEGDVQWLTAGNGIQHSEMFPLVHSDKPNPTELFQIWLNMPAASKTAPPHFTIAWHEDQPRFEQGGAVLQLVGGSFMGMEGVPPPPNSYAAQLDSQVVVARISLQPGAAITLPAAQEAGLNRVAYFYSGKNLTIDTTVVEHCNSMAKLRADREVTLRASTGVCELLFLQGKPIGEPVVQHGPFVCANKKQLEQVFARFEKTQFGGWKWKRPDPVHSRAQGRFYQLKGGKKIEPPRLDNE
ncbi:hypothetical protein BASA81_010595 [Batrachochytrium salamandrivorans]|nr:hypothetical protein BASA81_010595 [Batrachochytrium salamandrivorans]